MLLWILAILLILLLLYLFLICPALRRPKADHLMGWKYAHRGLHDGNRKVAENSLEAFRRAVDAGYGMELDVQLTKDDQLVVFHDKSLKRVCGVDVDLCTQTYDELRQYFLPGGQQIPLFSEVLELVDGKTPLIVEVKYHDRLIETCKAAHKQLKQYKGSYCVESFHPLAVRYFRKNAPEIVRGQLASGGSNADKHTSSLNHFCMKHLLVNVLGRPHFVAYSVPEDKSLSVTLMRKLFRPYLAGWTIRSQEVMDYAQKEGFQLPIFELFTPEE
ncbi:MAG: glycerophosphodiester phosphodiesterase [Clostridiales bacterium]|nr:glycerophosphodiester phosphodiesterase [Clostridiales bacterium]